MGIWTIIGVAIALALAVFIYLIAMVFGEDTPQHYTVVERREPGVNSNYHTVRGANVESTKEKEIKNKVNKLVSEVNGIKVNQLEEIDRQDLVIEGLKLEIGWLKEILTDGDKLRTEHAKTEEINRHKKAMVIIEDTKEKR